MLVERRNSLIKSKKQTKPTKQKSTPRLGTAVNSLARRHAWPGTAGNFAKHETKVSKVSARSVKAQAVRVLQWMDEFFAQHGTEQTSYAAESPGR